MARIILHIGAPKCGSGALQTALTEAPLHTSANGERLEYVGVLESGGLLRGRLLAATAAKRSLPLVKASGLIRFLRAGEDGKPSLSRLSDSLNQLLGSGTSPILSCEGFLHLLVPHLRSRFFASLEGSIEAMVYVRPPVEYINTSWWQYGAWSDKSFDQFVERGIRNSKWMYHVSKWKQRRVCEKLHVRPLPNDIVADFANLLEIDLCFGSRVNRSLPASILRLYQRHRDLRPSANDNSMDRVLSSHLTMSPEPTPWVISQETIARIIDATTIQNKRLLGIMDSSCAEAIAGDPRWWDPACYSERQVESPDVEKPDAGAIDNLAAESCRTIARLAKRVKMLENRIHVMETEEVRKIELGYLLDSTDSYT